RQWRWCRTTRPGDWDPNSAAEWYGTIASGASTSPSAMTLNSVTASGPAGSVVITNVAVTAASGTNTAAKQQAVANALAASIIAKAGLAQPYTACVKTPTGGGVPACSTYGITLDGTNVVAVVPISCPSGTSGKPVPTCTLLKDGSRAGTTLSVSSGTASTALLYVSGSTNPTKNQVQSQLNYGGVAMFSSSLTFNRGINAAAVAAALRDKIGTKGTVRAWVGGTSGSGAICQAAPNTALCLVDSAADAEGKNITGNLPTNNTSGRTTYLGFSVSAAVSDGIPTSVTELGASVFVRTDIVSSRSSYPKSLGRSDCAAETSCSYDEEMTNFANWYAYYKTRNQMMKTTVGQAFQPIGDNYNVGLTSLSSAAAEGSMMKPNRFSGTHRSNWYDTLYAMNGSQSTPIRQALHAIGKLYANQAPYEYQGDNQVVKFPCQQNFTIVTTDGYWNGNAAATVVSNDETESASRFCLRSKGCVDATSQTANSLADVALYWYNGGSNDDTTSLRPAMEDWTRPGLVPAAPGENQRLHMKTYTLGLGVDGIMNYEPNYDTAVREGGDFYKLITGVTSGCPWNGGGAYVWPDPKTGDNGGSAAYQSRVDDLWHAAINGHGKYFSASDPLQVVEGLRSALSNIEVKSGAAAASATSTPNVSQYDNDIYSATFTTVKWFGQLTKRAIDPVTGDVGANDLWNSSTVVGRKVEDSADSRRILMLDVGTRALKDFDYAEMSAGERAWFDNKCGAMSQCANLSSTNRAIVNSGANVVNWLRGQQQYADDTVMRAYSRSETIPQGMSSTVPLVLGDIASAKPAFVRDPRKKYPRAGYEDFAVDNADRPGTVYAAANDGMLHAFASTDGEELWAYVPRITMKKLHLQASVNYGVNHQYTVDGSPETADVQINGEWRTVLVGGLNAGGRGYYALDVTDPAQPRGLWELCADASVCSGINYEPEIGLSFGNAQFGTWKNASGAERWVVFLTSGYNNIPGTDGVNTGSGKGFLFVVDVATGQVLDRISTNAGTTTTPSGFAKITAITENPTIDPLVTYVYGGDNQGQMWRFDFTSPGTVRTIKMGDAGANQPITTRPDVALCQVERTNTDGSKTLDVQRVVAFGTGRLLDIGDIGNTAVQSAYVLGDTGVAVSAAQWRTTSSMIKMTLTKTTTAAGDLYASDGAAVDLSKHAGWYVDFDRNAGERVNLDPNIVLGTLRVVTNIPSSSSSCSVGGTSNIYGFDLCTGKGSGQTLSNNAGVVGSTDISLPDGSTYTLATPATGGIIKVPTTSAVKIPTRRSGVRRVRE
uniref:pilus assembly protein n=1 Tax=uncultured Massilia sp. TaxID=169973 RepID=UPI00258B8160